MISFVIAYRANAVAVNLTVAQSFVHPVMQASISIQHPSATTTISQPAASTDPANITSV